MAAVPFRAAGGVSAIHQDPLTEMAHCAAAGTAAPDEEGDRVFAIRVDSRCPVKGLSGVYYRTQGVSYLRESRSLYMGPCETNPDVLGVYYSQYEGPCGRSGLGEGTGRASYSKPGNLPLGNLDVPLAQYAGLHGYTEPGHTRPEETLEYIRGGDPHFHGRRLHIPREYVTEYRTQPHPDWLPANLEQYFREVPVAQRSAAGKPEPSLRTRGRSS